MRVLIPAGGSGLRLRPLTDFLPKPLLPLGERPVLTRVVAGIPPEIPVTVAVTAELEKAFRRWREGLAPQRDIEIYSERPRPAPAGPVVALAECVLDLRITEDVVVLLGDTLLSFTLRDFLGSGRPDEPRLAAFDVGDRVAARRFGVVEISEHGMVASFAEKPECPASSWVFTGCIYLPARLVELLPEIAAACPSQLGQLVAGYLERGVTIEAMRAAGEWHDIGTFDAYLRAHALFLSGERRAALLAMGNEVRGCTYVHPAARVSDSVLHDCVVFADATVRNSTLAETVVGTGAVVVDRVLKRTFVHEGRELPVPAGETLG